MNTRWPFRGALLLIAAVFVTPFVAAQNLTDAERILQRRATSNTALATKNLEAFHSTLDDDYHMTFGDGGLVDEDELRAILTRIMAGERFVAYARTPATVEVDDTGQRAYESGSWIGQGTAPGDDRRVGGRYAAHWRVRDGQWVIHAELFVTLFYQGDWER